MEITKQLMLFFDLNDYSVLPDIARSIVRHGDYKMFYDIYDHFKDKIANIVQDRSSKKSKQETCVLRHHLYSFCTNIFSTFDLYYPIIISRYQHSNPKGLFNFKFTSQHRYYVVSDEDKNKRSAKFDSIVFVPSDHNIYPVDNQLLRALSYPSATKTDTVKTFIQCKSTSFFNSSVNLRVNYQNKEYNLLLPHEDFFDLIEQSQIILKGNNPYAFKRSNNT